VQAGLVDLPEKFPYCFTYLAKQKQQGLKSPNLSQQLRPD
jgi:hypothetical protein